MGGKKKEAKVAKVAVDDDSTEKIYAAYRRKLKEFGLDMPRRMIEKFNEIRDEKNPGTLTDLIIWEPIGPLGARAMGEALKEVKYEHLKQVRFWKSGIEDEGVRALVAYIEGNPNIKHVELMDSGLTQLACEFLARPLGPVINHPLALLKLDHSSIGDDGLAMLARGLAMNQTLKILSLAYCDITVLGARALLEIVIFHKSAISDLDLQGNYLRAEGTEEFLHGLKINKSIDKLNLADNQIDDTIFKCFPDFLAGNQTLKKLDISANNFSEEGIPVLSQALGAVNEEGLPVNATLLDLTMPASLSKEILDEIDAVMSAKKPKKGKKGKGKKGKKK